MTRLIFALLAGVFLGAQYAPSRAVPEAAAHAGRPLWKDIVPDSATNIRVLGKNYAPAAYRSLRQQAVDQWQGELALRYRTHFKTSWSRFAEMAWTGNDDKIREIRHQTERFMIEIYPRYFRYEPAHPWRIVCFDNKREFAQATGSSAYGFYRPAERTLYSYAWSGNGTFWHELIHAYMDQNCDRDPPQWFKEGLASFYEMAWLDGAGRVVEGFANWRHPSLVQAIRTGRLIPLGQFLDELTMSGSNGYARARFLFCFLWTRRLLVPFVQHMLYTVLPEVPKGEIGQHAAHWLVQNLGLPLVRIEAEMHALALATRRDEKMHQVGTGNGPNLR